jgi:hypothetical protein
MLMVAVIALFPVDLSRNSTAHFNTSEYNIHTK